MKETMVTDIVIQALKMDDTIKRQELEIQQLRASNAELHLLITRIKEKLAYYVPDYTTQLDLFNL